MPGSSSSEFVDTRSLPCPDWTDFFHRIYLDEGLKERVVRHGLLFEQLQDRGLDRFTVSQHGLVLLYGPPGTGKTTLAKGAANEIALRSRAEIAFRHARIDQLGSSQLGGTPEAVANVFEDIRTEAERGVRQILLLDEVESLFTERSQLGGDTEPEDVRKGVNTALNELDKLAETSNVFTIATSNQPDIIDQAFQGRADEALKVGMPGPRQRASILTDVFRSFNESLETDLPTRSLALGDLVQVTKGFSGRQIRKKVHNSLLRDGLATDPSQLTREHVRDEFHQESSGDSFVHEFVFPDREVANKAREAVPEEFQTDRYDRRHKSLELKHDAPGEWVEFVAGLPEASPVSGEGDGFQWGAESDLPALPEGNPGPDQYAGVHSLLPRLAVYESTFSEPTANLLKKIREVAERTLGLAGYSHLEWASKVLKDERVKQTVVRYTELQAIQGVRIEVDGFSFGVDVEYDSGTEDFLDPPDPGIVPELDGQPASITFLVEGSEQECVAQLKGVDGPVSVIFEPESGEGVDG